MISDSQLVEVFRKTRHDWLNQLQLIKANVSMNRFDRIDTIIDQIVEEFQNESNLSNLKATRLSAFLLLHKTITTNYHLNLDVEPMSLDLSKKDEEITESLETLFKTMTAYAPSSNLLLTIKKEGEGVTFILRCPHNGAPLYDIEEQLKQLNRGREGAINITTKEDNLFFILTWPGL